MEQREESRRRFYVPPQWVYRERKLSDILTTSEHSDPNEGEWDIIQQGGNNG